MILLNVKTLTVQSKSYLIKRRTVQFLEKYFENNCNATEAAMQTFNCTTRESAQAMGSYYLKKSKPYLRMLLEEKGFSFGKMIDIAIEKLYKYDNSLPWFDRLMHIAEYDTQTIAY